MPYNMDLNTRKGHSRYKSLLIREALSKLKDSSAIIERRGFLKDSEAKRVSEAFSILSTDPQQHENSYTLFLSKVKRLVRGENYAALIVLCVVALGKNAIKNMRERVRLDLPYEVAEQEEGLNNHVLSDIGKIFNGSLSLFFTLSAKSLG